jgi:dynein light intermediate chain 1
MIPSGWDSWGKIEILKDGFDCQRVNAMWEVALAREAKRIGSTSGKGGDEGLVEDDEEEVVQQVWRDVMPDASVEPLVSRPCQVDTGYG